MKIIKAQWQNAEHTAINIFYDNDTNGPRFEGTEAWEQTLDDVEASGIVVAPFVDKFVPRTYKHDRAGQINSAMPINEQIEAIRESLGGRPEKLDALNVIVAKAKLDKPAPDSEAEFDAEAK